MIGMMLLETRQLMMNDHSEASVIQLKNSRNLAIREKEARDGVVGHWAPLLLRTFFLLRSSLIYDPFSSHELPLHTH